MIRRLFALALALVLLPLAAGSARPARTSPRLVIVSWDGAADWVVDRLLADGKLPNLARIVAGGVRARYSTPAFPSKTACGHAAIWTGAYSDVNGISGNAVPLLPRAEHTLLESRSGFDAASLRAEPLWITAARAGRRVAVLSATQVFPADRDVATLRAAGIPADRFVSYSGFESSIAPGEVLTAAGSRPAAGWTGEPKHDGQARELEFTVGEQSFAALVYDDPADPVVGLDTVMVREGGKDAARPSAIVKPREAGTALDAWSERFRVTKGELFGYTYFRLFDLSADGSRMTLYRRSVNGIRGSASRAETEAYLAAYGGFHDDVFFSVYRDGGFGPTLENGGDGTAERRVLETVRMDAAFLKRSVRYGLEHYDPDLLFQYTPSIDSAGHSWIGALDPESPRYDAALATKIWPFYEEVFRIEDDWIGTILDLTGDDTIVCLVSDHGMIGSGKWFYPNAVLERAGLLGREGGKISLERTKACAPPWGDFLLAINGTDWKSGVVAPAERERVLDEAERALLAAVDPETGTRIVTKVFRPTDVVGLGIDGPTCGDLYFDVAPGYYPSNRVSDKVVAAYPNRIGNGEHGYFPLRTKLQAIFYVKGPGVARGVEISGIRQIDIAPTLARLLGIPPPRDAQGHVVGEVVAGSR